MNANSVTYTRDKTLIHDCDTHERRTQCQVRPWECKAPCGTPIARHSAHRHSDAKTECVVCIYMRYEHFEEARSK